jgi:hypothetical protein
MVLWKNLSRLGIFGIMSLISPGDSKSRPDVPPFDFGSGRGQDIRSGLTGI